MSRLEANIREAVATERYVVGWHADEQCESRRISAWQLAAELDHAVVIRERPASRPNPSIVLDQTLADGTRVTVIWAWLSRTGRAKLVTVYFND